MSLQERDKKVVWHPYTQSGIFPDSIPIVKGEGALLFDETGKSYIDAISSWWVNIHGHSNPILNQAISEQLNKLEQVIFAGFTHEPAVSLAEKLIELQPNFGKAFFSDNGSTAVEVALKMSLQYWKNIGLKKTKIIAFEHAYHGDTFGAMSLSGRSMFTAAFDELLFDVVHIPLPTKVDEDRCLNALKKCLFEDDVAAFIYEPLVLGSAGMLMCNENILHQILKICHEKNVLLIADEVMTGFGRTGPLFASDLMQIKPDMMCLSKGLTGGYLPMGLTLVSDKIHDAFVSNDFGKTLFHGHSYTGNLLSCAVALASLELTTSNDCVEARNRIAQSHQVFMKTLSSFECITNIRSRGTIVALDLMVKDAGYGSTVRKRIVEFFISKGVLIRPLGNVIYLLPPYCISAEQLQYCYDTIVEFLIEFQNQN